MFAELYRDAFSWDASLELSYVDTLMDNYATGSINRLLDIGAGTGRFSAGLAQRTQSYIAIEPDEQMRAELEVTFARFTETDKFKIIPSALEDTLLQEEADIAVALTDVVSYVYPLSRLSRFVSTLSLALRTNGLVVADVALWSGYIGERRNENWAVETIDGQLQAECAAEIIGLDGEFAIRRETIRFLSQERARVRECVREGILSALTPRQIIDIFENAGLGYQGAVVDGNLLAAPDVPSPGRAFLAFLKR